MVDPTRPRSPCILLIKKMNMWTALWACSRILRCLFLESYFASLRFPAFVPLFKSYQIRWLSDSDCHLKLVRFARATSSSLFHAHAAFQILPNYLTVWVRLSDKVGKICPHNIFKQKSSKGKGMQQACRPSTNLLCPHRAQLQIKNCIACRLVFVLWTWSGDVLCL